MKSSRFHLAVALCLSLIPTARAELVNAIEAIVHDAVITYHEVNALNEQTYDELRRRYRTEPLVFQQKEQAIMESMIDCGAHGWLMIAAGVVTYGVLALAGAALVKYLFFAGRGSATA